MAFLRGRNELRLNTATMMQIVEQYLMRNIVGDPSTCPKVVMVRWEPDDDSFVVQVDERTGAAK